MVVFNYSSRELTTKIVYYGPGLCGKTTNLQFIYDSMPTGVKGKMLSLATKSDRTLFFDFLPIDLGEIGGMKTKVQLYTVPGQVFYNETRRLVLKGADGVVFVADSQEDMMDANRDSFRNLEENLQGHGLELASTPHVVQYNKRDLPNALPVDRLNEALNQYNMPFYEAVATQGIGVQETLRHITKLVLVHLNERYGDKRRRSTAAAAEPAAAAQQPAAPEAPPLATPVDPAPAAAEELELPEDLLGPEPGPVHEEEPPVATPEPQAEPELPPLGMPADLERDEEPAALADLPEETEVEAAEADEPLGMPEAFEDEPEPLATPAQAAYEPGADEGFAPLAMPEAPRPSTGFDSAPKTPAEWDAPVSVDPEPGRPAERIAASADTGQPAAAMDASMAASRTLAMDMDDILGVSESLSEASVAVAVAEDEDAEVLPLADAPGVGRTQQIDRRELDAALAREPVIDPAAAAVEVGADDPLFHEPGVEPTRLTPGTAQEILVPLEVETPQGLRRFRLTLKLELGS